MEWMKPQRVVFNLREHRKEHSKFLAMISHEIRAPVNSILGFARLLGEADLPDEKQDYVETIIRSAEAMLRILEDILDFTCVDAGIFKIENEALDVRAVVDEVRQLMAHQAEEKGIFLKTNVDVPEKFVGDAGRLRQVLINLVSNAIKFTDKGHVTIRVRGDSTCVFFSVEDTGVGIPAEKLEAIFHPFTRCEKNGGNGLGLAISKHLVELMGGSLRMESKRGMGAVFSFELPLKQV